ncbi:MAG: sigma 54-interacting transcriptional regulator [Candidatus Latescibacterota bacterium]
MSWHTDRQLLLRVLAEVAQTASETLELQEVFDRVATSVRQLIPFEHMAVVRVLEGRWGVLHATTAPCRRAEHESCEPALLTSWSPRFRPQPGPARRIDDAQAELDPAFPMDAFLLGKGVRSSLWAPFYAGGSFSGGVWMNARTPHAFTDEHQEAIEAVAALLGSAVEHWRIWDAERRRAARLDQLEALLGALAESLDVGQVFERISAAVQPVLAHQLLVLTELDEQAHSFRVVAASGESDGQRPAAPVALAAEERTFDLLILQDLPAELGPTTERNRVLLGTGMRSLLRVPVLPLGQVRGFLVIFHREPARYGGDDVEVARRLADRLALTLSHQRLAEEARLAAEARERAERLEATVATLSRELEAREQTRIIGVSPSLKEVLAQVGRVAASDTTVLITGETGTGKEVVSRLIHQGSPRARRPFVAINCAALPEQLLESELFGHEKGAFTGAVAAKVGRLEQAAGGTLFLDEVAEMSPLVQAKLLRVLEDREFQRLGGTRTLKADVRLVAATNRDLEAAIARERFREDLYYRLNVFHIHVSPLRERPEDILPLAESLMEELGRTTGRPAAGISRDARDWLLAYPWPGNVRELRNAIERAILLCDGGLITSEHLPAALGRPRAVRARGHNGWLDPATPLPAGGVDLEAVEQSFVEKALREARGNRSKAARLLGLTRSQLYTRLGKYGID